MKNNQQKRNRTWRLARTYLAVMMVFSLMFSGVLFAIFSQNLKRDFRTPPKLREYSDELLNFSNSFEDQIQKRDVETLNSVLISLGLFNLLILGVGTWVSWLLARWTLRPIEENFERQSQFVSDASHEIRTPLAAMLASNEVALRKKVLTEEKSRQVLAKNIAEIQNLASLTENLLNLASAENSKSEKQKFEVLKTAEEVLAGVKTEAEKKQIVCETSGESFEINANQVAIKQILKILSENAVKYSEEKSRVEMKTWQNKKFAVFEVRDQGEGISKENQARIFERFYRVAEARTRDKNSGYGLGLAIVKSLAEQNKFEISVESEPGKGSKFSLKIPK